MRFVARELEVVVDHEIDELLERRARCPAKLLLRPPRIPEEQIDLGRTEVARIDLHEHATGAALDTLLVQILALPLDLDAGASERAVAELAHRVGRAGG